MQPAIPNLQGRSVQYWLGMALLGGAGVLASLLWLLPLDADGQLPFVLAAISGFFVLGGLGGLLSSLAIRRRPSPFAGDNLIAHWVYESDQWRQFTAVERARDAVNARRTVVACGVGCALFGAGDLV